MSTTRTCPPPRLLVVTPTLGESPWLGDTVLSVARHAGPGARHVLVCPEVKADRLARRFPELTVLPELGRPGLYSAINDGWRLSTDKPWDWFTWINDDDLLLPGFSAALQAAAESGPSDGLRPWFYGGLRLIDEDSNSLGRLALCRRPGDIGPLVDCGVSPLNQQGMLIPRAWMEHLEGLREDLRICADFDLWLRAHCEGADFRPVPGELAAFRLRAGQVSADLDRHRREFLETAARLRPSPAPGIARLAALTRFRFDNLGTYLGRLLRTGRLGGLALLDNERRRTR